MATKNDKQLIDPQLLKKTLEGSRQRFLDVLPQTESVDRLIRGFMLACAKRPDLYECTWQSLLGTVHEAATLGLDFSPTLGQAYPIRYGKECVMSAGYRGLIKLAVQSGDVVAAWARNVYSADQWEILQGTEERITHVPHVKGDRGEYVLSYAVALLKNGTTVFEWMSNDDMEKVRAQSKAKDGGAWVIHTDEMRKVKVMRRLLKYRVMSPEASRALEVEDNAEAGIVGDERIDVTPVPTPDKATEIADDIDAARERLDLREPGEEPEEVAT